MKKIAVILSGCGVFDGAEIHESVLTLLSIEQQGGQYQCFAPEMEQMHVVNHATGEVAEGESRNVLVESARIARGDIKQLSVVDANEFDALIIPGGFGAAKNLCDFAVQGVDCQINQEVITAVRAFKQANKPIGLMCIAPVMIPALFGQGATGTIGTDVDTASAFTQMGGVHQQADVHNIVIDESNKVVTTPAYMLATSISEAYSGIHKLVAKVIELA
ncbi:isoprenoid biosynthesis protein ElbB [Parashewanella curva]|uniref:Glyoxalase n=1 Tax=Parashewanella curva TaxID=2338552 RepID=A0A3L8PRP8_9GAMM|nr:isoprenoid biosynthesis glyoxalase ElbB [Parashewanella curva]RLV58071.1 isoprenoid biosynthesis protein ElbB [Parashewanella curva]